MSSTPKDIGTLIVVVLKANHLPNKRHIGKQDPYCLCIVNGEKKRTKAIKRGGQHPEWDEELRFTLYEDSDDLLARTAHGDGPPPLPPKDSKGPRKIKGGTIMKLACYADDPREPDLIGETNVDLTEVLTKGETDEWFTLTNKEKFAGKVYLELTFWSNEPPPEKKTTPKPPKASKQYGGPGSFVPSNDSPNSRIAQPNSVYNHSRPSSESVPSSLRASNSLAKLDLYVPPYENPGNASLDKVTHEFGELGLDRQRRRESTAHTAYSYPPSVNPYLGDSTFGHDPSLPSVNAYGTQSQYSYEANQHTYPSRPTRQNIPVSSSGFMPMNTASTFSPTHVPENPGYPPLSHTPAPVTYNPAAYPPQPSYLPPSTPLPVAHTATPYIPATTPGPYPLTQSLPNSQFMPYPAYTSPTPIPPQQYAPTPAPPPVGHNQPQAQQNVPNSYQNYPTMTHSHSHETLSANTSASNISSRPLPPQPQVVYAQAPATSQDTVHPLPLPPPPPPAPPVQYQQVPQPQPYSTNGTTSTALPPPPPPPPLPPPQMPPHRTSSLPLPPTSYSPQQLPYQPPPPPPPPSLPTPETYPSAVRVPPPPPPPPPLPHIQAQPQVFNPGPVQMHVNQWNQ